MIAMLRKIGRLFLAFIPDNYYFYLFCKRYVDRYNGENSGDIRVNGELSLLKKMLPGAKTVFDIGANVGEWAELALSIDSKLHLHCFEPSKVTFSKLKDNHFPANVACNNFGLSSVAGEKKLFIFNDGAGINSLYQRTGLEKFGIETQTKEEIVKLEVFDDYCRRNNIDIVDFVKVDVEGHELEVFKGMADSLAKGNIGVIQFEYGGCNIDSKVLLKDIWSFFSAFPYTFFKLYPNNIKRVSGYSQEFENFQYQNWAIILNKRVESGVVAF